MTQKKHVAKTLKEVLDHPTMMLIMDRSKNINPVVEEVCSWWGYDLFNRKPGPAYDEDEVFIGTDLDLACFLYELSNRNAVINIPSYKSMRKRTSKEGQMITSAENRHGQILGLTANKDVFSFSVRIKDMNVISTESVGDYRNFSLTNLEGDWYDGWKTIQFLPNAKENNFINENKLFSDNNKIVFKNFSHPNRKVSFFGQPYFITKALINRLTEEITHYKTLINQMIAQGIKYPEEKEPQKWPDKTSEKGKSVKIKAFQVEIDIPDNDTKFPICTYNQKNLVEITDRRKYFLYKVIPKLRFMTRATELAFYKYGNNNMFPSWLGNVKWESYTIPGKRIKWDRLVLFQPGVGERAISIRKREFEKSEMVSENY